MAIFRNLFGKPPSADWQQLIQLGNEKEDAGDLVGAVDLYREAVRLSPQSGKAHLNLGIALAALGNTAEATRAYDDGLAADAGNPFLHYNRALLKYQLGDRRGAELDVRNALARKGDLVPAHILLSNILDDLDDPAGALAAIDAAIALNPDSAGAHLNRGRLLLVQLRIDEALAAAEAGLRISGDDGELHWLVAVASLLKGDFARGWAEYEWRFRVADSQPLHEFGLPRWDGRDVKEQTVVLLAEQGLGDSIQFMRYVPLVVQRAKSVVLQLPASLHGMARQTFGDSCRVVGTDEAVKADLQCPLLSVPAFFGADEKSIPKSVPYLRADAARVDVWRKRLEESGHQGPRVGLVCSGRPTHLNDSNRSMALELFRKSLPGSCEYVLLQPEVRDADMETIRNWPALRTFTRELTDFVETAALMQGLDLVVTVDTSVAHLAGALGRPVWVLLPHYPDWRWLLERSDSPWYPTARLYRQDRPKDWSSVLARVAEDLHATRPPAHPH